MKCHAVWSATGTIFSSHSSVTKSIVAKWYILQQVSGQMNRNAILQLSTPLHWPYPLKLSTPKIWTFYLLIIFHFLDHVTTLFVLIRTWDSMLSRWSLNDASYSVRTAISATAGLLLVLCHMQCTAWISNKLRTATYSHNSRQLHNTSIKLLQTMNMNSMSAR